MSCVPRFAIPLLAVAVHAYMPLAFAAPEEKGLQVLEEVVVTAQRREQTLQEVPISVQVVNEDALEQNNVTSLTDIGTITPGLSLTSSGVAETISMRGIATRTLSLALQNSTAIYLDGVYLSGGTTILGDLQDIARVEVLRGPQGTLFGRNAAAGAISVTTNEPTETFHGDITGGLGNDGQRYVNATLNAPLSDSVLTRTTVARALGDGVYGNASGGKRFSSTDSLSGRSRITWLADNNLTVDLIVDASRYDGTRAPMVLDRAGNNPGTTISGLSKISDRRFPDSLVILDADGNPQALDPSYGDSTNDGAALKLSWDLNDTMTLSSLTAWRQAETVGHSGTGGLVSFDFGLGPTPAVSGYVSDATDKREEFSQELRLSGTNELMDWFVGANYSATENSRRDRMALPASLSLGAAGNFDDSAQNVDIEIDNLALFGDAVIPLTDDVNVSVGARYSKDETAVKWHAVQNKAEVFYANIPAGGIKVDDSWSNASGRVVFDWTVNESINTYAGVSQGYKSGGFATLLAPTFDPTLPVSASLINPFKEEKAINYEIGIKSSLLDDSMYLNAALYHTDYKDYQMQAGDPADQRRVIIDTADAFSRGLEVDLTWLATEQLTVGFNLGLNESEFKEGNLVVDKGQDLLRAPEFTAALNLDYFQPVERGALRYNMTYSYSSTQRMTNSRVADIPNKPGYTFKKSDLYTGSTDNLNARISFTPTSERWEAALWATNLLDRAYREDSDIVLSNGTYDQMGGAARVYFRNPPRAFGAELTYYFGEL
ncbi:TonB-dependent receptor [Parendozoicomonas haliclonae]|uniref:Pesticin receptor n=1 Tax=Parendozoicomonas haliclonae TaxID=1960125 RepID=A0A1X7AP86_9GAMM|nr:TonB-dependent receptor [Parendozoicomonas haliclonae]SMA49932.1 Pesticin receptor precursor [Parendozoicomonas haliclonae]